MSTPSVVLLGGNGYIGSGLTEHLAHTYAVQSIDLNWFSEGAPGTVRDIASLTKDDLAPFDVVVLLSGHSSVRMCAPDWASTEANNVRNFEHILSQLTSQRFIYASSSSVYGITSKMLLNELEPLESPLSEYDRSKQLIDKLAQQSAIEYYGLRFGTVNGGAPHMRIDLMMNAMFHSATTRNVVELFNPTIHRPILGMHDCARALSAIIDSPHDNRGIYNLASFNTTAHHIAKSVSDATSAPIVAPSPGPIINTKLQTAAYDFSIDTSLFENTFDFEFLDTPETIIATIQEWYPSAHKTTRHENRRYR